MQDSCRASYQATVHSPPTWAHEQLSSSNAEIHGCFHLKIQLLTTNEKRADLNWEDGLWEYCCEVCITTLPLSCLTLFHHITDQFLAGYWRPIQGYTCICLHWVLFKDFIFFASSSPYTWPLYSLEKDVICHCIPQTFGWLSKSINYVFGNISCQWSFSSSQMASRSSSSYVSAVENMVQEIQCTDINGVMLSKATI